MLVNKDKQSGNVLFLILIAVALFAALSYAVTSSSRSGGKNADDDINRLAASEILQYAAYVKSEVDRMRISRGLEPDELDFQSDVFLNWHSTSVPYIEANPNCTSSDCFVFKSKGGRVTEQIFEKYAALPWSRPDSSTVTYPGHIAIRRMNIADIGTSNEELTMLVYHLKPDVCKAINDLLGLPSTVLDSQEWGSSIGSVRYYNLDNPAITDIMGDSVTDLAGQHSACASVASQHGYVFYTTLVSR